jgi:hypothetical protein
MALTPKEYQLIHENRLRRVYNKLAIFRVFELLRQYQLTRIDEKKDELTSKVIPSSIIISCLVSIAFFIFIGPLFQSYSKFRQEKKAWRENGIQNSPVVCLTRTGTKYHNCYHYNKRNYEVNLFVAVIDKKKEPCGTCNPIVMDFGEKPKFKSINPYLLLALLILFLFYFNFKTIGKHRKEIKAIYFERVQPES